MSGVAVIDDEWQFDDEGRGRITGAKRLLWLVTALFVVAFTWAWFAKLDEVASGSGRVVPTSREQIIQSLEGGILAKLMVKQDDIVKPGQILAQLDPTQAGSTVDESAAKYRAALASAARLRAEVGGTPIAFSRELDPYPELKAAETRLSRAVLADARNGLGQPTADRAILLHHDRTATDRICADEQLAAA